MENSARANCRTERALRSRNDLAYLADRLRELMGLSVGELRDEFLRAYGFATHSRNKDYLRRRVAWKMQADADGGLSQGALARIEELAPLAPVTWQAKLKEVQLPDVETDHEAPRRPAPAKDRRLPRPGTIITRVYDGTEHQVRILKDGFEYNGGVYPSLSRVAREITGTNWNGFLFFRMALGSRGQSPRGNQ